MRVICVGPTGEELFTARPSSIDPIGFGWVGATFTPWGGFPYIDTCGRNMIV